MGMIDSFIDENGRCPKCDRKVASWQTKFLYSLSEVWRKGDFFQYRRHEGTPRPRRRVRLLSTSLERWVSDVPLVRNGEVPVDTYCGNCRWLLEAYAVIENGNFRRVSRMRATRKLPIVKPVPPKNHPPPPLETHFATCAVCGRKILIQIALAGFSHTLNLVAVCGDCIRKKGVAPEYENVDPATARRIETWARTG